MAECDEVGCDKPSRARGKCRNHYQVARERGEYGGELCTEDECDRYAHALGRCQRHYARVKDTGRPCSIPECPTSAVAKDLCAKHYNRQLTYPEINTPEAHRYFDAERLCDLCGEIPACRIDHDHETRRVRGYLCQPCNTGLGKLGDSIDGLKAAIAYLERAEVAPPWD